MTLMVKETVEEQRYLTIEEHCMFSVQANVDDSWDDGYVEAVRNELFDNHGFVEIIYDGDTKRCGHTELYKGLFRKVTTRPATNNERRAYYYLKTVRGRYCYDSRDECATRPLNYRCNAIMYIRDQCTNLMKNKEFYETED